MKPPQKNPDLGQPLVLVALTLILAFLGAGCERSTAFKRDQGYYQDPPDSYYTKTPSRGQSLANRVEAQGQPKKRVIVLDFWNDTPVPGKELGTFAADELRRGLLLTQRMMISPDLKSELGTEDFVDAGRGDSVRVAQLVREGRRLGVAVLGIGRVTRIVFRQNGDDVGILRQKQTRVAVTVEMKLFDVAAGRELMATSRSGEASSSTIVTLEDNDLTSPEARTEMSKLALREAVARLVPDVVKSVDKLTWEGRIAKVVGNKVYVNAGQASGLLSGDILRVMAPGDDIYDPSTGAFLGRTRGQLKGTLEVVDFLGSDGAVTEIHTGGNFQESDMVQLY